MENKISGLVITYNEEKNIVELIQNLSFVDEIIIVDSCSTDATKTLVSNYKEVQFVENQFQDFTKQRNLALSHAKYPWILFLDADERVTQKLKIEILETINNPKHKAYKIKFPHYYMNRFLYHTENKVVRLVENKNIRFEGLVHEKLLHDGSVGLLKNFMLHYTYKGLFHYIKKKDSYAWFQAKMSKEKNKSANYIHLIFKPLYRFFHTYIIRKGFLDGVPGLAVASIDAYGVFSRYVKMILLERDLK